MASLSQKTFILSFCFSVSVCFSPFLNIKIVIYLFQCSVLRLVIFQSFCPVLQALSKEFQLARNSKIYLNNANSALFHGYQVMALFHQSIFEFIAGFPQAQISFINQMMNNQNTNKKHKKKTEVPEYKNLTPFKAMQKHFKRYHNQETDYSIVSQPQKYEQVLGFQLFHLPYPEGAILVRNFNNNQTVLDIAAQALNVYCLKPYRTNLNSREELYKEKQEQPNQQLKPQEQLKGEKNQIKVQAQQETNGQNKGYIFNDKIRWANVGYQYDWTQRKYPNVKTQIPESIAALCVRANQLFNEIRKTKKNYYPQSAIINYYSQKDYMTGHLDDAEIDQHSPIYSFSLGLSCIFLIGDSTKDTKPVAVRLNSGDLFIMSGKSRLAYHGVPRIISNTYLWEEVETKAEWSEEWLNSPKNVLNYLQNHRININVRQVYPSED